MAERIIFIRPIVSPQATISSLNGISLMEYFVLYDQTISSISEIAPLFLNFKAEVSITGNMLTNSKKSMDKLISNTFNRLENAKINLNAKLTLERAIVDSFDSHILNLTRYMRRAKGEQVHNSKQYTQNIYLHGHVILPSTSENMSRIYHLENYSNLAKILTAIVISDRALKVPCDIISEQKFNASVVSIKNIERSPIIMKKNYYDMQNLFYNILNVDEHKIRSLIIDGDVRWNSSAELKFPNTFARIINSIEADNFFNSVVLKSQSGKQETIEIAGSKTFISEINILSSHINEFNKQIQIRDWFSHSLRQQRTEKRVKQIIQSSGWQFVNTVSDNFEIKQTVNGIHLAISSNESGSAVFSYDNNNVIITSDISFSNDVRFTNKFNCDQLRPCNVNKLALNTLNLPQSTWDRLGIIGDVKLLMAELNELSLPDDTFNFLEVAFTSNADAIVVTDVIFKTNIGRIILNRVDQASSNHPNIISINNIDFVKIFNDAITHTQLARFHSGKQLIAKETVCSGLENVLFDSIIVQLINDVDIKSLDRLLFIGSSNDIPILSMQRILFLRDIEVQAVYINESQTLNGITFTDVYFIHSETLSQRPIISFEADLNNQVAIVADLAIDVKSINGFNWHFFIKNGFRLRNRLELPIDRQIHEIFDGFPTFENLILLGDKMKIDQINDVVFDDIVLKNSNENQQISGNKQMSLLHIKNPSHTWEMNNFELVSIFTKTILLNHMQIVEQLVIRNPFQLKCISISVNRTNNNEIN